MNCMAVQTAIRNDMKFGSLCQLALNIKNLNFEDVT